MTLAITFVVAFIVGYIAGWGRRADRRETLQRAVPPMVEDQATKLRQMVDDAPYVSSGRAITGITTWANALCMLFDN